jgi:hypothetical protein
MDGFNLVHDVQDAQLLDKRQAKIGRVDGLVLELRDGQPPRVAAILIGGSVRDARIAAWVLALTRVFRRVMRMKLDVVSRIPFSAVREISDVVEVDVEEESLESEHVERWLCEHVVRRIPGGDREAK